MQESRSVDDVETWHPVVGRAGYEVSDLGNVRSFVLSSRRIGNTPHLLLLRHKSGRIGYVWVRFGPAWAQDEDYVHHLVLEAFVGPRPDGMMACHNDSNVRNNRLSNLRWDTQSGNLADRNERGTAPHGVRNHSAKLTDEQVRMIRKSDRSNRSLGEELGVHHKTVAGIRARRAWKHIP